MSNSTYPKAKSLLFVSSIKPENFKPGFESEADAIILDIEDSVPKDRKDEGRTNILNFCKQNNQYVIDYCSDDRIIAREYELV